ncbi:hypothetical protein [Candidatus Mycoplasma haematohominis]|uniref:hypothetical protein n=1 Tax=Candidatus Mycoplasma haematohominis TaxID=1494318 RepID=UPI001C0A6D39|nr:hypothetical protein [Candidatus Mycoplasma haemohominis]
MQLIPPAAKLGGGAVAVISSSAATTTQVKSKLQSENFYNTFKVNSNRQTSYTFKEIFGSKLRDTTAENYEQLEENKRGDWRDRFAKLYKERDSLKSYRFNLLIAENVLKNKPESEDKSKEGIKALDTQDSVQEFMKNFYQECRNLSRFVFGKSDHKNHWQIMVKKFLNDKDSATQQDEKEARYFRDAWVACSISENDESIDPSWPYQQKISSSKSNWHDQK